MGASTPSYFFLTPNTYYLTPTFLFGSGYAGLGSHQRNAAQNRLDISRELGQ